MSLFNKTFSFIFISFIALTLCFGRAFSIIHIGQVFITEIILFLGAIFLLLNFKEILKLPRVFLIPFSVYFIIGCLYFAKGLLEFNLYALRDIVFFGYALFLPVTFIIFSKRGLLKTFLWVLVLSNIFAVTLTRLLIYRNIWLSFKDFLFHKIRAFNYLLYFGITVSFLIPLFGYLKEMKYKIPAVLLCAFNLYLIMIWGERSAWLASAVLFIFLISVMGKVTMKFLLYFFVALVIVSSVFVFRLDSRQARDELIRGKIATLSNFINRFTKVEKKEESLSGSGEKTAGSPKKEIRVAEDEGPKPEEPYLSNLGFRLYMWNMALESGFQSPVFGKGFGVLLESPKPWKVSVFGVNSGLTTPHNHLLSIFYKMGLLGTGLFLFMNIYVLLFGISFIKDSKDAFLKFFATGSLGGFVFWHAMAAFFNVMDSPPTSIFLWVIAGFIFACSRMDKEGASGEKDGK